MKRFPNHFKILMNMVLALALALNLTPTVWAQEASRPFSRGIWVWSTSKILQDKEETKLLLKELKKAQMTDVYLYLKISHFTDNEAALQNLLEKFHEANIRVWGMDGDRNYLSDRAGPKHLYTLTDHMIAFNKKAFPKAKFVGLQTDIEVNDRHDVDQKTFHNGLATSALSKTGGGVWKKSQAEDREFLLRDFLEIHQTLKEKLSTQQLSLAAAVPSWFDSYSGEELTVNYKGTQQGITPHLMDIVDHYQIMSYNTQPKAVLHLVSGELAAADRLNANKRSGNPVKVWLGMETLKGPGEGVSYGDQAQKNSQEALFRDLEILERGLLDRNSFQGINIHSWEGLRALQPIRTVKIGKWKRFLGFFQNLFGNHRPSC